MPSIDLWYTTRASGLVALVLLSGTVVLGILTAGRARSALPGFARAEVHRRLSVLTVVFLAVHVLTAEIDTYVKVGWLAVVAPFTSSYHRTWLALGTIGADLLLAVAISHALGMGTDSKLTWALGLLAVCTAGVVVAAGWRVAGAHRAKAALPRTVIRARRSIRSRAAGATPGIGGRP